MNARIVAVTLFSIVIMTSVLCASSHGYAADRSYIVEKGDNLWSVADSTYGQGIYYHEIFEANKGVIGENEDLIFPGMVFYLPNISAEKSVKNGRTGDTAKSEKTNNTTNTTYDTAAAASKGSVSDKENNAEDKISDYFSAYYKALADGDAAYCESMYEDISIGDKEMVDAIASYIDRFENIRCRTLEGPVADSYIAFVDYEAVATKDNIRYEIMDVFYLYKDKDTVFRIESPETYFKDSGKIRSTSGR